MIDRGPAPTEEIGEPARILAVLRGLRAGQVAGRVRLGDGSDGGPACVAGIGRRGELALQLEFPGPPPAPPFDIAFGHFNSVFSFRIDRGAVQLESVIAPLPERVTRRRLRVHRRAPAPRGAVVALRHPCGASELVRPLVDVSVGGFAFRLRSDDEAFAVGSALAGVVVTFPDRPPVHGRGEIRHADGGRRCGVRFTPASHADREAWTAATDECLYANTRVADDAAKALWELYARAGYFELSGKNEEQFIARHEAFHAANRRLGHARGIGCQVVWPSTRGVEAAVTMLKPYTRAWVGFQLARRRDGTPGDEPRRILREVILHGYEYPQRDPDFEWLVTWVQESGRFSRLLMHELTARYGKRDQLAAIVRFHALEAQTDRTLAVPPADVEVGAPAPDELATALAAIRRTRPWPYVAAHDLTPERFDLAPVREAWRAAGLARERDVLIARRGGRVEAVAVLELAEDGVHLYALFDVVRLFAVTPGGAASFPWLLEAARRWYAARGKKTFVYFCEDDPAPAVALGFADLGAADMTVLAAALLPEQLVHAWEITAPRDAEGQAR